MKKRCLTIGECCARMAQRIGVVDSELIVAHAIGQSRVFVLSHPEQTLSAAHQRRIALFFRRRKNGEPIAYIVGEKEFFNLSFLVTPDVLVPRPETETLVQFAIDALHRTKNVRRRAIVDVGTGSGNIIISIAKNLIAHTQQPNMYDFYGTDRSGAALAVARKNAQRQGVEKKIKFLHGTMLEPILRRPSITTQWSELILVANLPYLDRKRKKHILAHPDGRALPHEPQQALWSHSSGLAHYAALFRHIRIFSTRFPRCRIVCACEIDSSQKNSIRTTAREILPLGTMRILRDLSAQPRVFVWTKVL